MAENLNCVMRSATENLHPNIGKLTAGGIERGVRKRRTRRITQIAGAAASVTAVFGVVAMVGLPGGGSSAGVSAASGTGGAVAAKAAPLNANTEAAPAPGKPFGSPVTGEQMATRLQQVLEPYHFSGEQVLAKRGSQDMGGPFATLRIGYDNQAGSAGISVERATYQDEGQLPPYNSVKRLPDGSHLAVFNGPEWPAGNGDPTAKRIDVEWYRTDGVAVRIILLNEVQEKGATTATGLGLTVDQATKVVQSPVWDEAVSAVLVKPLQYKSGGAGQTSTPTAPVAQ